MSDGILPIIQAFNISRSWVVVSCTIVCYDYLVTLPDEILLFWAGTRLGVPSALFYLVRYVAILGHIPIAYTAFTHIQDISLHPPPILSSSFYCSDIVHSLCLVLLGLRASVFYSNQRRIVWLIIGALILSQVMSVSLTTLSEFAPWAPLPPQYVLLGNCKISLGQIQGYYVTGAWLSLLVYDALMFYMTIRKTIPMTRGVTLKHSLIQVLQREGITYFGVLFLLYIINIGTLLFSPPYYKGVLITFINALSCVLSGRVMLHIREAARRSISASSCNIPLETVRFLPQGSLAGTQPEPRDAI